MGNYVGNARVEGFVPTECTRSDSEVLTDTANSITVSYTSKIKNEPSETNPLNLWRKEDIFVAYTTDKDSWAVIRSYSDGNILGIPPIEQFATNFWPNSSGIGSDTIPAFNFGIPPQLLHLTGLSELLTNNAQEMNNNVFCFHKSWTLTPF